MDDENEWEGGQRGEHSPCTEREENVYDENQWEGGWPTYPGWVMGRRSKLRMRKLRMMMRMILLIGVE